MRILFVLSDITTCGGTERVTCEMAAAFSSAGHEVSVLSLFNSNVSYFDLPHAVKVDGLSLSQPQGRLRQYAQVAYALFTYCRRAHANVVILVDTILFAFCAPWSLCMASRFVCWEHFNLSTDHGSRFRTLARQAAVWLSDSVVVLTEQDARAWREHYRIGHRRVRAIWNPMPRLRQPTAAAKTGDHKIVLSVGRLTHQKGFDLLLQAWRLLNKEHTSWQLRIVGGGEDKAKLKQLAQELEITDSVAFIGQSREVEKEYLSASIYVMSSRWEGFGMTLLEAQYFGLPCVATDCEAGPREALTSESGLLVPVEDPQALASALAKVMGDSDLRNTMAVAARDNVKHYQAENIRVQWEQMFNEMGNSE